MTPVRHSNLIWVCLLVGVIAAVSLKGQAPWLVVYPTGWVVPVAGPMNEAMNAFIAVAGPAFRAASDMLAVPLMLVQKLLAWLPWPATMALVAILAHAAGGWRLVMFSLIALGYMLVIGYWHESMRSLALVSLSVPLAVVIGFVLGVAGFYWPRAERIITPTLDILQTVPAFAYLLPILLLFGFGPVVGLIASVLFSFPPMVRNTILGLKRVPEETVESGLMSGATAWQLFYLVRVPSALRQILLGVNQSMMASFSMVIIASIIGGTADIGWEVLSTMRKAEFGESLLAGIVIALLAMVMDRISVGLATRSRDTGDGPAKGPIAGHPYLIAAIVALVTSFAAAKLFPFFAEYPESWRWYPADALNAGLNFIVVEHRAWIEKIKSLSFFYLMLPARIGLAATISPYSWGFEFTTSYKLAYAGLSALAMAMAWWRRGLGLALAIGFAVVILYVGFTNLPWPAVMAMAAMLAWRLAGWRLALGTVGGLGAVLVAGLWPQAMLSVYLCGLAVMLSFAIGGLIGIAAAQFAPVSAFIRPINDALQTMPLFVILIPFVMIFKIGEFTALLAIIAYAIVPAIRYTEHGLRNLPGEVIEAASAMGASGWQMLWQVKLPMALPVIMLGLNQTIMYAIAMLVIAALVGTSGLGQQVYIGLGNGDFGVGMAAGLAMAIIAIIADRLTSAWNGNTQHTMAASPDAD